MYIKVRKGIEEYTVRIITFTNKLKNISTFLFLLCKYIIILTFAIRFNKINMLEEDILLKLKSMFSKKK